MKKIKGYTILEMLFVIIIFPLMLLSVTKLFHTFVKDIPRAYRTVQEDITLLDMLRQIHNDVSTSKDLPSTFGNYASNKDSILIETAQGVILYKIEKGSISRKILKSGETNLETKNWRLPESKVDWQIWRKDRKGYALAIQAGIEQKNAKRTEMKMENSYLYFVGTGTDRIQ